MKQVHFLSVLVMAFTAVCFLSIIVPAQQAGDSRSPLIINPFPTAGNQNPEDLEEIFGADSIILGGTGLRGRGNIFHCTNARKLLAHKFYLNLNEVTDIWFLVYEGDTFLNGVFNRVSAIKKLNQGPGQGWYSSDSVGYDLVPGKYYMIYAQWSGSSNWYNDQNVTPYPVPCSFGSQYAGVGWQCGPVVSDPPPMTQTNCEVENEGVSYFQSIISTPIVPVELISFTYMVSSADVNLNWTTATEQNNKGFEIQRASGNEFTTIGFIGGYGTSTEVHSYSFIDKDLNPGNYSYRLKQVDFDGTSTISEQLNVVITQPQQFGLEQNYPNPFNPSTKIKYSLPETGHVSLKVYDIIGNEIAVLVSESKSMGTYEAEFNSGQLTSGIYFYKLEQGKFSEIRKMTLLK
jgi:hypothetical protein